MRALIGFGSIIATGSDTLSFKVLPVVEAASVDGLAEDLS